MLKSDFYFFFNLIPFSSFTDIYCFAIIRLLMSASLPAIDFFFSYYLGLALLWICFGENTKTYMIFHTYCKEV